MVRWVLILLWCVIVAPICLFWLWVKRSGRVLLPCCFKKEKKTKTDGDEERRSLKRPTIESLLLSKPGGVGADKLREFLEDPMDNNDVRQDEKDRPTMAEHIKLLRNHLEERSKGSEIRGHGAELLRLMRERTVG